MFVVCPVEVCIERDVKGMYKKPLAGEIQNFIGVSDPYVAPTNPALIIPTAQEPSESSLARIVESLVDQKFLPPDASSP